MFLRKIYCFALIILTAGSPASFSQSCEPAFSSSANEIKRSDINNKHSATGIESYRELLIRLAQSGLGVKKLSSKQIKALETYHQIVQGEKGRDGTFAKVGNYTFSQRRRIIQFLREVFSPEQVTTLIEDGVVEINRSSNVKISKRVLRHFNEGKKVFIQILHGAASYGGILFRISKILEETDSGFLVEAEGMDQRFSRIIREKLFLITDNIDLPLIRADPENMTKISEKTNRGFVIDILEKEYSDFGVAVIAGNKVFFSFDKAIENDLLPKDPTLQDYREIEDMINAYISSNHDKTFDWKNTPYQMNNDAITGNGKVYYNFADSLEKSFIKGVHDFRLANPESEVIFLAIESNRERINSGELDFFPSTDKEVQLVEQGYKSNYTGLIDQVSKWSVVRRKLQELQVNPRKTHIEYFANQVPVHIAYIRQGLDADLSNKKSEQLKQLSSLEKKAKQKVEDGEVTYKWWLEFNIKLAHIMYGRPNVTLHKESDGGLVAMSLSFFPLIIVMPTMQVKEGPGIITFNRVGLEGVQLAGLINQKTAIADGDRVLPAPDFFGHDVFHARFKGNRLHWEYSAGHRLFHKRLLENIERLPPERRKKAEAVYFVMTHENIANNIGYSDWSPQKLKENMMAMIHNDVAGLFRFSDDPVKKEQKIEDLTDTFMEVYNQALQHQE